MRKLKQRTDPALQESTELGELAALLDTWQPEAPNTDLWPLLAARLQVAETAFAAELQRTPIPMPTEMRELLRKHHESTQHLTAHLEPFGTDVKVWTEAVVRLAAQSGPPKPPIKHNVSFPIGKEKEREQWATEAFRERLPVVDITQYQPDQDAVALVPADIARRHRLIPVRRDGQTLYVAMADPQNIAGVDDVKIASGKKIVRALWAYPPDIDAAIEACYGVTAPGGDRDRLPPQPPTAVGTSSGDEFDPLKEFSFTAFVADREGASSVALLSPRQERWLARCIEKGGKQGEKAREILVNANLRLVTAIAKKYENQGIATENLIQEGTLGLIYAVEKYDWRRGFRFSTYATHWIRQALGRAVAGQGRIIRLPESAVAHLEQIRQARESFTATHGRYPTAVELAEAAHLPQERVELLLEAETPEPMSLDAPAGDSTTRLGDLLPAEDATSPASRIFRRALRDEINKALEHLSEREEVVSELAALRREVTRLREEVAALRRERSGGGYPTLMPYARADDKPLPLG